jgi:O-phosphoseryl-tRNA synthetase
MRFDPEKFRKLAKEQFEEAWQKGPEVISPQGIESYYPRLEYKKAAAHPIFSMVHRLREVYLSLGFDEICNPIIVDEKEVYRQFRPGLRC